eukprot:ctg_3363.g423
MHEAGVRADTMTYNALIDACSKDEAVDMAFQVCARMEAEDLQPTIFTFNALIASGGGGAGFVHSEHAVDSVQARRGCAPGAGGGRRTGGAARHRVGRGRAQHSHPLERGAVELVARIGNRTVAGVVGAASGGDRLDDAGAAVTGVVLCGATRLGGGRAADRGGGVLRHIVVGAVVAGSVVRVFAGAAWGWRGRKCGNGGVSACLPSTGAEGAARCAHGAGISGVRLERYRVGRRRCGNRTAGGVGGRDGIVVAFRRGGTGVDRSAAVQVLNAQAGALPPRE